MTVPVVNVYKLGRMPYPVALRIQQVLFDNLKQNVSLPLSSRSASESSIINNNGIYCYQKSHNIQHRNDFVTTNNNQQDQHQRLSTLDHGAIIRHDYYVKQKSQPSTKRHLDTNTNTHHINNNTPVTKSTSIDPNLSFSYINQARNSLLLVEHEPVYTIGIRSLDYNDEYVTKLKKKLSEYQMEAEFVKTNRGGLITFHGPGQLVAYPIIYLGDFKTTIQNKSVRAYVNKLETVIIDTLNRVGIRGAHSVRQYPGVWVGGGDRKIAFIGISCNRYVTMHGISINCNCDLSWFDQIVSCGIENKQITSIQQELSLQQGSNKDHTGENQQCAPSDESSQLKFIMGLDSNDELLRSSEEINSNNSELTVDRLCNFFCESFSQHFGCKITERSSTCLLSIID